MDPYWSTDDEDDKSISVDDPEQMVQVLHQFFNSDECGLYDLSLLPRKNVAACIDPLVRHHYGVKSVTCLPSNPTSFEELKRRQVSPRSRGWFRDDFTTYPEYAISNNSKTIDDVSFPFDFNPNQENSFKKKSHFHGHEESKEILASNFDDNFFDAFENDFKDILLAGELSDLSVTVTNTFTTPFSRGIDSYQRLRTNAEKDWKLYAVQEEIEENVQPLPTLPSQIRRTRHAASASVTSSLTSESMDSSTTEFYDARAQYFDEDVRFDKNGLTPGYHHPVDHIETPINHYTISALLARAKSMLVDHRTKRNENQETLNDNLIQELRKDSSSPHSLAESSISDDEEVAPPAVVAFDQSSSYSVVSEVSNTSSKRMIMSRKEVKVLLNKLEEESQTRRARFGLEER